MRNHAHHHQRPTCSSGWALQFGRGANGWPGPHPHCARRHFTGSCCAPPATFLCLVNCCRGMVNGTRTLHGFVLDHSLWMDLCCMCPPKCLSGHSKSPHLLDRAPSNNSAPLGGGCWGGGSHSTHPPDTTPLKDWAQLSPGPSANKNFLRRLWRQFVQIKKNFSGASRTSAPLCGGVQTPAPGCPPKRSPLAAASTCSGLHAFGLFAVDFGVAETFTPREPSMNLHCGSLDFMAPEVIKAKKRKDHYYDEKCDLWSIGLCTPCAGNKWWCSLLWSKWQGHLDAACCAGPRPRGTK